MENLGYVLEDYRNGLMMLESDPNIGLSLLRQVVQMMGVSLNEKYHLLGLIHHSINDFKDYMRDKYDIT